MNIPESRDHAIAEALIEFLDGLEYRAGILDASLDAKRDEERYFLRAKVHVTKSIKHWLIQRVGRYNPEFYGKVNEGHLVSDHNAQELTAIIEQEEIL